MTLEEAKRLKPGDRVLIEATIGESLDNDGEVKIKAARAKNFCSLLWYVSADSIREKIASPRKKFKKGDIVSRNGHLYYVAEDELEDGRVILDCYGIGIMYTRADLLKLEKSAVRKEAK